MTFPRSLAPYGFRLVAVAGLLLLQPYPAEAAGITTSFLSQEPLQGLNPVKPNIMFTVDDSGSMAQEYLPDFSLEGPIGTVAHYCRDDRYCGGVLGGPGPNFVINLLALDPPVRSSNQNKQYYDPSATYLAGTDPRSVGGSLPYERANPGNWTSVYVNGYAGYPGANNGVTIDLVTGYPDTAWCNRLAAAPPSALDLASAYGDGSKCRLNGRAYNRVISISGDVTPSIAAGYNYPNRMDVATGAPTACTGVEYCDFTIPAVVFGNPYYYTISKVQFCTNKDALGFGAAPCQDRWDENNFRYVRYSTTTTSNFVSFDPKAFTRVDIVPATPIYPSGRTYAQEMANFAKWYAFYRDRISSIKSAGGLAFSILTKDNARVGFHVINRYLDFFAPVKPFDATQKTDWFNKFYAVPPSGATPLPAAASRIGEYFRSPGSSGLPDTTDPLDLNGPSPTGQCQANYHLLATDGYWNGTPATTVGDSDRTVPASLPKPIPGFTPNAQFPRPYYEGSTASSDNLADIAMHYWITDLRPTLADRVNDTVAPWQHVTLFGVSQGAQGNIVFDPGGANTTDPARRAIYDANFGAIVNGTRDWPVATGAGGPESVDDLWHAAVNSRGDFVTAQDSQELARTMVGWITKITSQAGTGTGVGIAGAQLTSALHFAYKTSFETGWWGDVKKYALDANTGALPVDSAGNPTNPAVWSAAAQLDALAQGSGWKDSRRIVTINDSSNAAVPFRYDSLSPSQQTSLNAGWVAASVTPAPTSSSILDFLRGDRSNEGVGVTSFRIRSHVLGDIVYSGAVAVGVPSQPYVDASNPGYQDFATRSVAATRTPMVYVGANDGMVHAFDDTPCNGAPTDNPPYLCPANAGREVWAFVPKVLFSNEDPNREGDPAKPPTAYQLGALSYNTRPLFSHKFYVNATARAWDVDFANTNTSTPPTSGNRWRTVLIGGLGAGGRSVYALDVTAPPSATDTEATIVSGKKVLWEFTDANLGYTFDPPTLVKTYAYGWVVLVPSGYNNPGGKGFLYVLNPETGQLVHPTYGKIPLPNTPLASDPGSDNEPTGLSTIRAYTPSRRDPYVLQAYGGDLHGNVWRFDLSSADPSTWKAELIAKLKDASNNEQPITTGVRIEIDQNNNVDRYLFIGTGKLLGPDDINSSTVRNSMYVIRDGTRTAAEPAPAIPYGRANLNSVNGAAVSDVTVVANSRGWYQDATDPSEKIGTDVFADVQTVVFAFSKPTNDPCGAPLSSTLYARDLNTGNSVLIAPNGGVVPGYAISSGIAGVGLIQGTAGSSSSSSSSGDVRALVTTMKGEVFSFGIRLTGAASAKHRVSWRLLTRD